MIVIRCIASYLMVSPCYYFFQRPTLISLWLQSNIPACKESVVISENRFNGFSYDTN